MGLKPIAKPAHRLTDAGIVGDGGSSIYSVLSEIITQGSQARYGGFASSVRLRKCGGITVTRLWITSVSS